MVGMVRIAAQDKVLLLPFLTSGNPCMCAGPTVRDPAFIYMEHGQLHIGDFNTTIKSTGSPPGLEWRKCTIT